MMENECFDNRTYNACSSDNLLKVKRSPTMYELIYNLEDNEERFFLLKKNEMITYLAIQGKECKG